MLEGPWSVSVKRDLLLLPWLLMTILGTSIWGSIHGLPQEVPGRQAQRKAAEGVHVEPAVLGWVSQPYCGDLPRRWA